MFYEYLSIIYSSFIHYSHYLYKQIAHPSWNNYFYWLIVLSMLTWIFEIINPWRQNQAIFRKDFWLDFFYIFFNFFLFALIGFSALSNLSLKIWNQLYHSIGIHSLVLIDLTTIHPILQYCIMFIVADFIQWNIHRLLHKSTTLWQFHKLHHSIEEMGFAGHFRYHWMETIIYKTLQYIPLAMLGFSVKSFFILHIISILIGHLNHSNINIGYGPLKYIFNNPKMHIWHHAKDLPNYGVNFGISLSIWDYIFKTAYIPYDGKDIPLGYHGMEEMPKSFLQQCIYPWFSKKHS